MQYTVLSVLALAASASALSAGWNVTLDYQVISQQVVSYDLESVFVSDAYPEGLPSTCSWVLRGGAVAGVTCTPDSFSVDPQVDGSKYCSSQNTPWVGKRLTINS